MYMYMYITVCVMSMYYSNSGVDDVIAETQDLAATSTSTDLSTASYLDLGVEYTITLVAVNAIGSSEESEARMYTRREEQQRKNIHVMMNEVECTCTDIIIYIIITFHTHTHVCMYLHTYVHMYVCTYTRAYPGRKNRVGLKKMAHVAWRKC